MQPGDEKYQELCRLIEERSTEPLSRENRDFLLTLDAATADRFIEVARTAPPPEPVIRWADVGAVVLVLVPALALTGLWGWFVPYDAQTPSLVKLIIPALAVVCMLLGLVVDGVTQRYVVRVVLGLMLLLTLLAVVFGVTEWLTRDFGEPVNVWVGMGVIAAVVATGEMLNAIFQGIGGTYLQKCEARWRRRQYLSAAAYSIVGSCAVVFPLLWPFKGRESSGE